jgi:FAD/FMN-containing dehydrogenase
MNANPLFGKPLAMSRRAAMRLLTLAGGFVLSGCTSLSRRTVAWDELQRSVAGKVVPREDAAYEAKRLAAVWNALKPARRPAAIVQVASVADVQACVRFAKQSGLKVAVRGGGHNWNGAPLREGGLLLDLSRLNEVSINAAARMASVQPVVTNRDLARQLAAHGLAFPVGHCPSVTLSGYLLGGGFGFNAGEWGVACFNVTGMEIVTASGELVQANERAHADLYWAARGAGSGFFGVVTRYQLKLFPLPTHIQSSTMIFPLDRAGGVAAWLAATVAKFPANVECTLLYASAPPELAAKIKQLCIVSAQAFAMSKADAEAALAPVAACPLSEPLTKDLNRPVTFDDLFNDLDRALPHGKRYAVDTFWLNAGPVAVLQQAARHYAKSPSPDSMMLALVMPPPADAPPMPDTAFSMVGPAYVGCYGVWSDAAQDAENLQWVRLLSTTFRGETMGHCLGETDLTADNERTARSFAKPNWERLQALRAKFDPDGVFHTWLSPRG